MQLIVALLALAGSASAFVPGATQGRMVTALNSRFANQIWGIEQKQEIYK